MVALPKGQSPPTTPSVRPERRALIRPVADKMEPGSIFSGVSRRCRAKGMPNQDLGASFARVWSLIDTPHSACPDVQLDDVLDAMASVLLESRGESSPEERIRARQQITGGVEGPASER